MDFYVIPPNSQLDMMHHGDRYFALCHLYIANKAYRDFFKARVAEGKFVTLDNGAAEHSLVTEDILIDCVKDLIPNEVIAPDVLFNKDLTLSNLYSFIERMKQEGLIDKVNIFACPQGENFTNWLECYQTMLDNEYVKVIGLSKIAVPFAINQVKGDQLIAESRNRMFDILEDSGLITKPIHCLGMGDPNEFTHYNNHSMMRSTDSCYTVLSAIKGVDFSAGDFRRIPTPHDYFDSILSQEDCELALKNINYFRTLLNH